MNRYDSFSTAMNTRFRAIAALVAAGLGAATMTQAAPQTLNARQRVAESSTFTLDFVDFGLERQANVSATQFRLAVDAVAGTAQFVDYYQEIAPLLLPGPEGDVSTGNIIVEIEPSALPGTYDSATGEFSTPEDDTYVIHFDGDLSAYDLYTPVELPAASTGTVSFTGARTGRIDLDWAGVGQLPNPFVPGANIIFNYTCEVATAFGPRAVRTFEVEPIESKRSASAGGSSATDVAPSAEEIEANAEKSNCTTAHAASDEQNAEE